MEATAINPLARVTLCVALFLLITPLALGITAFLMSRWGGDAAQDPILKSIVLILLVAHRLGALAGCVGVILLGICVDGVEYRPAWLLWTMLCLGALWLFHFPEGTLLGIVLIAYTVLKLRRSLPA